MRGLLDDPAYPYRRMYLIDTLRMLGARDESLEHSLRVLAESASSEEVELALHDIAEHAPERLAQRG